MFTFELLQGFIERGFTMRCLNSDFIVDEMSETAKAEMSEKDKIRNVMLIFFLLLTIMCAGILMASYRYEYTSIFLIFLVAGKLPLGALILVLYITPKERETDYFLQERKEGEIIAAEVKNIDEKAQIVVTVETDGSTNEYIIGKPMLPQRKVYVDTKVRRNLSGFVELFYPT